MQMRILGKVFLAFLIVLALSACRASMEEERDLGKQFTFYELGGRESGRIEYEGKVKPPYTVVKNAVDGLYNVAEYIVATRRPIPHEFDTKEQATMDIACEYYIVNKTTHERQVLKDLNAFKQRLTQLNINPDDLGYRFDRTDLMSCAI